jgi:flagellar motor switch protein FliN/FliY
MTLTSQECRDRFVAELATVIGAMSGGTATGGPGTEAPSDGWVVTLRASEGSRGDLVVEFDRLATEALAKRIMGMEDDPPAADVVDTLKELCAQAVGSMILAAPLVGTRIAVASVERTAGAAPQSAMLAQISEEAVAPLPLRLSGEFTLIEVVPAAAAPAPSSAAALTPVAVTPRIDLILDIELPLTVRFGLTEMPLRLISALGPGSVIDLGRSPDDPVDLLVSNQLVARGEVVIVGGNYGVRITDVISPENRIRSMEDKF